MRVSPTRARASWPGRAPVIEADPQLAIDSWCGKKFRPERVAARPGFDRIDAVAAGRLHEIKSADILQPGPVALERGLDALHETIRHAANVLAETSERETSERDVREIVRPGSRVRPVAGSGR